MQADLTGRVALVTGASRGLGLAMATAFAKAGAAVAITARGAEALAAAEASIRAAAPSATLKAVAADMGTEAGCAATVEETVASLGQIDILVNNAGTAAHGPFLEITDAAWQADFDLKFFGAIRLCRAVLPGMRERRWGRVINVLNIGAKAPGAASMPTTVTRAAGMAMTKALANEFAPHNVLLNALLVGIIESDQWRRRHAADKRGLSWEDWKTEQAKPVPLGRLGLAEEFAATALFLCSEGGSYITGTALNVDGGRSPVM